MSVEIKGEAAFDFAGEEFESVFAKSDATGFQSPVWLNSLTGPLASELDMSPLAVTLREGDELVGAVPLLRRKLQGLVLVESTDAGVSDYAAPVLKDGLLEKLKSDPKTSDQFKAALGNFDILRIRPSLPEHVEAWKVLTGVEPKELDFSAHAVKLTRPHEDWRSENVEKSLRSMMMRKGKRWKKQNEVAFERMQTPEDAENAITELAAMRKGRFEGDPIQQDAVRKFYADVAANGVTSGSTEIWRISSDGEPAVIVFGLIDKGQFLYLLIGANYDDFGRHSPGLVAYDHIMDDWSSRGGEVFDFTIGDEPFKAKFGAQPKQMSTFLMANSLKGRLAMKLFGKKLGR